MELVHCLIIGFVIAAIVHIIRHDIMASIPARLKKHVTRNGLIRGWLIYAIERH